MRSFLAAAIDEEVQERGVAVEKGEHMASMLLVVRDFIRPLRRGWPPMVVMIGSPTICRRSSQCCGQPASRLGSAGSDPTEPTFGVSQSGRTS